MKSTLSVYLLTYNRAQYLKESVESILNQSYRDFQLFILDNCSSDNTKEVVERIHDNRLVYIRHQENIGGIGNINYAIKHCSSEYMVIFHDDDVMLPFFLETELKIIKTDDRLSAVSGNAKSLGSEHDHVLLSKCGGLYSNNDIIIDFLKTGKVLIFPSLMYRNSFLKKHSLFLDQTAGPSADLVFYNNICKMGGIIHEIPDVVMEYRVHPNQDSQINKYSMLVQLIDYLYNDEKDKPLFSYYGSVFYSRWLKILIVDYVFGRIPLAVLDNTSKNLRKHIVVKRNFNFKLMLFGAKFAPCLVKWIYTISNR